MKRKQCLCFPWFANVQHQKQLELKKQMFCPVLILMEERNKSLKRNRLFNYYQIQKVKFCDKIVKGIAQVHNLYKKKPSSQNKLQLGTHILIGNSPVTKFEQWNYYNFHPKLFYASYELELLKGVYTLTKLLIILFHRNTSHETFSF